MTDGDNKRTTVRYTNKQLKELEKIYGEGKFKHWSEMLRHLLNIGIEQYKKQNKL